MFCPYAREVQNGKTIECKIDSRSCPYTRWCSTEHKSKNTSFYVTCGTYKDMAKKKTNKQALKEQTVKAEEPKAVAVEKEQTAEHKTKICPVILTTYQETIFSFDGYGISRPFHSMTENVIVEYDGKFGQKDFVIYSVKDYVE